MVLSRFDLPRFSIETGKATICKGGHIVKEAHTVRDFMVTILPNGYA